MNDNEEIREGIKKREQVAFDLHLWQKGDDHFTCQLFSLIQKADRQNRARLFTAFPLEVSVWLEWHDSPTEKIFFEKYNLWERHAGTP